MRRFDRSTTWIVICSFRKSNVFHRNFVVQFSLRRDRRLGWNVFGVEGHTVRGCKEECRKDGARYWADGKSELTELFKRTLKIQFSLAWLI